VTFAVTRRNGTSQENIRQFVLDRSARVLHHRRLNIVTEHTQGLITHPATTTHSSVSDEMKAQLGIGGGLLRLSVGLETADDLMNDLGAALD